MSVQKENAMVVGQRLLCNRVHYETQISQKRPMGENVRMIRFKKSVASVISNEEDDSFSTSSSSTQVPVAPDGGYGWIIVLASFMIHFICDGISFSFGIMFPQIQEHFKESKTMSGVVGSIFLSIPLLSGPLAGALTDIYDCRRMTIIGGLIAAGGTLISFFAFNVWQFLFTFAIITGIGLSFCFNTAIVAVTYYFQEKRAIATGIAVCGSGAGTFMLAPIMELLFTTFGWRLSLVALGFLLLCLVGCGFMIKDLEWPHDTLEYKRKKFIEKTEREKLRNGLCNIGDESSVFTMEFTHVGVSPRRAISLPVLPTFAVIDMQSTKKYSEAIFAVNEFHETVARSRSVGTFLHAARESGKDYKNARQSQQEKDTLLSSACNHPNNRLNDLRSVDVDSTSDAAGESIVNNKTKKLSSNISLDRISEKEEEICESNVKFVFTNSKDVTIPDTAGVEPLIKNENEKTKIPKQQIGARVDVDVVPGRAKISKHPCIVSSVGAAQGRVPAANAVSFGWRVEPFGDGMCRRIPSAPAVYYRGKRKRKRFQLDKMMESLLEWISDTWLLLYVPEFVIFLLSTFILYIFFDIPYVNFPEYAVEHHNVTENEASYLVSGIGLTNMFSMLFCGFIADWGKTRKYVMQLYGVFIMLAGICVAMAPYARSYSELMVLCVGFGFFISANYVLASVITVHVLCLYDFQTGYGILCLVEGLGNLIGPALVGFIRDNISGYDNIFLFGGVGTVLSGFMVLFIDVYMRLTGSGNEVQGEP